MDHVAIMKSSWGLLPKVLSGQKSIESRWYRVRVSPWNRIAVGDTVYFKDSGCPVTAKAKVSRVLQFSNLTPQRVKQILAHCGKQDGIESDKIAYFYELFKNKNYCILVFLKNPQKVKPFRINKSGFGSMSAWITVEDIAMLKRLGAGEQPAS